MKLIKVIVTVLVLVTFWSCKEKDVLPAPTGEGLNTFGVKIDGKVWLPKQTISVVGSQPMLRSGYSNGVMSITARRGVNDEVILLTIRDVRSEGNYVLNSDEDDWLPVSDYHGKDVDDNYVPYTGGVNEVRITKLDTVNKIAAGTFKCQLKGKNKQAIVNFTEGVFDVKLTDN